MKKPAIPINEVERLKTLHSLELLDTAPEERFDRLTRLARHMFNVPIALVSLVDQDRQWFKSAMGLDVRETRRDISFCGHAILGEGIFHIADARADDRFSDNPLVTGTPNIRFYAGCPLRAINGQKMGTLCLIDNQPRKMSENDLTALQDLANMAERELASAQLATLDDLTMISNRRGFMLLADKALKMCARSNQPASILMIDLDGFKQINDQYGHTEGDRALICFTNMILQTFRDSDIFSRLGGDEFCILLTNTDEEQAQDSLSRLRYLVSDFNIRGQLPYPINFSAGITTVDFTRPYNLTDLMKHSDKQMYLEKEASKL